MTDTAARNAEIFVRRCTGDTFAEIGLRFGISRARVFRIYERAVDHAALGLPMTLPHGHGAWKHTKAQEAARGRVG